MKVLLIAVALVLSMGGGDPLPPPGSAESNVEVGDSLVCPLWEDSNEPGDSFSLEEHRSFLPSPELTQVVVPGLTCSWRSCRPPFDKACFATVEVYCREAHPHDVDAFDLCYCFNSIPECCGRLGP